MKFDSINTASSVAVYMQIENLVQIPRFVSNNHIFMHAVEYRGCFHSCSGESQCANKLLPFEQNE